MSNLLSTKNVTAIAAAALTLGSVAVASAQTPTPSPSPSPAPSPRLTFSGLLDMYYAYSFNNPKDGNISTGTPGNNSGQNPGANDIAYNYRQDAPTLTLGQLDAAYATPADGGFGAHVTLINGNTANADHTGNEARFDDLMQVYGTLINKTGWGVDFGEFYTPFGYEADNDSNLNPNYSFSDVYFDLLPVYNSGLRFYTPTIFNGLVLKAYVVNALNDTSNEGFHDDNNAKGLFGVAAYTDPKGKFTFTENYGFSHDQNVQVMPSFVLPTSGLGWSTDDTTLSDTDLVITPNSKLTIGAELVYRADSGTNYAFAPVETGGTTPDVTLLDGGTVSETVSPNHVYSQGYAYYLVYNTTSLDDIAFRYSQVAQDELGSPSDFTATYAFKSSDSKWLTKLEYRYDHINNNGANLSGLFEDSSGNFTATSNNTLTVGEVYTF